MSARAVAFVPSLPPLDAPPLTVGHGHVTEKSSSHGGTENTEDAFFDGRSG